MSTGVFHVRQSYSGRRPGTVPENRKAFFWPQEQIDRLCDLIADGATFTVAARNLGVTKNAAMGQFSRIRAKYGWQAA